MKKNIKSTILLTSLMLMPAIALANSDFNNELTKLEVSQSNNDVVHVNIFTNLPYSERIIVNKKADNKYVILLPETSNLMLEKPNLSNASGIKDVEIKTQDNSSIPGKAYTKITFSTKKPVNIIPQSYTSQPNKVVSKKPEPTKTQAPKTITKVTPIVEKKSPIVAPQQITMALPERAVHTPKQEEPAKTIRRDENRPNVIKPAPRPVFSSIESFFETPQKASPSKETVIERKEPIVEKTVTEQKVEEPIQQTTEEVATTETTETVTEEKLQEEPVLAPIRTGNLFLKGLKNIDQAIFDSLKKLINWKTNVSLGLIMLQLLIFVVTFKLLILGFDKVKKYVNSKPKTLKKGRNKLIHEEQSLESYPTYSNMDVYNKNKSSFEEDIHVGFNTQKVEKPINYKQNISSLYSNESFYKPITEIDEEIKMSIFDENDDDIEKTIFKNPLTQLSEEEEASLFDDDDDSYDESESYEEYEDEENDTIIEEEVEEDPYEFEEEDFLHSTKKSSDEDFFIFEDEDDLDDIDNDDDEDENDDDFESFEDDEDDEIEEDIEEEDDDDDIIEEEPAPQQNSSNQINVMSKYSIDEHKGFSIVQVSNINALIGYIDSKIFVLKKFDHEIKEKIQVRLNEQPENDKYVYLIKVSGYKTLIEVTPDNIRPLLDL